MGALLNFKVAILFDHPEGKLSLEDVDLVLTKFGEVPKQPASYLNLILMHTTIHGRALASIQEDTFYWNVWQVSKYSILLYSSLFYSMLIQAGGRTVRSEINNFINSFWNRE